MADQAGKIFVPSGDAELRDQFLRDIRLAAIDTGVAEPPTTPGTDWYLLGTALAQLSLLSLGNVAIADADNSVLTASDAALETDREALGLPEVAAVGATGKIVPSISGPTTIVNGTAFALGNGLRGHVVGTWVNPADGDEIDVACDDTGNVTNQPGGAIVRFVAPPTNVAIEAKVSTGSPLVGGTDAETPNRKRDRILNTLRNKPAGGNWAHLRQIALDANGAVQDCYVYPALGGPASQKVVPIKDFDIDNNDYSRSPSSSLLATIRAAIQSQVPTHADTVVEAPADQLVDFTLRLTIPDSVLGGGNGQGWIDFSPWPPALVGDGYAVGISAVSSTAPQVTVWASTTTAPIAGQTNIAWWSAADRHFYTALVTGVSGGSGAWVLTLDRQLSDSTGAGPQIADLVCPAAQNLDRYGSAWVDLFRALGPGENTADGNRLPRARRHPFVTDEDPQGFTGTTLGTFARAFPEITDIAYGVYAVTNPSVPASVDLPPNVLVPRKFAIYKL